MQDATSRLIVAALAVSTWCGCACCTPSRRVVGQAQPPAPYADEAEPHVSYRRQVEAVLAEHSRPPVNALRSAAPSVAAQIGDEDGYADEVGSSLRSASQPEPARTTLRFAPSTDRSPPAARPKLVGSRLNLDGGPTAAEKALDLSSKLSTLEKEHAAVKARLRQMEADLAKRDQQLQVASNELRAAELRTRIETTLANYTNDRLVAGVVADSVLNGDSRRYPVRQVDNQQPTYLDDRLHLPERIRDRAQAHRTKPPIIGDLPATRNYGPSFAGANLELGPGKTAAERSMELLARLQAIEDQRDSLNDQVQHLEHEMQLREEKLSEAVREIQAARQELGHSREQLDSWKKAVEDLRDKVKKMEHDHLETLRAFVDFLNVLLGDAGPNTGAK